MFQSPFDAIYRRSQLRLKAQKEFYKGIDLCVNVFCQLYLQAVKMLYLQAVYIVIYTPPDMGSSHLPPFFKCYSTSSLVNVATKSREI